MSRDSLGEASHMRDYLLHRLDEGEQSRFEDRYFQDTEAFDHLSAVEDDLIDDFVRNTLPAAELEAFEKHYLINDERREKVRLARAIRELRSEHRQAACKVIAFPYWRAAGAVAAMLMVTVGVWRFLGTEGKSEAPQPVAQLPSPLPSPAPAVQTTEPAKPQPVLVAGIPSVTLQGGFNRGSGEGNRVAVAPDAKSVRLRVAVSAGETASMEIQTPEGSVIWKSAPLRVRQSHVEALVPAARLVPGTYIVKVTPQGDEFPLEVTRR